LKVLCVTSANYSACSESSRVNSNVCSTHWLVQGSTNFYQKVYFFAFFGFSGCKHKFYTHFTQAAFFRLDISVICPMLY